MRAQQERELFHFENFFRSAPGVIGSRVRGGARSSALMFIGYRVRSREGRIVSGWKFYRRARELADSINRTILFKFFRCPSPFCW